MIVMVSTNTLSAREPDHSARMNPSEITSKRPPRSTSSMVGSITRSTALWVRNCPEMSSTATRTSSTWAGEKRSETYPTAPASAKTSGGTESTAKNAASAANPATR